MLKTTLFIAQRGKPICILISHQNHTKKNIWKHMLRLSEHFFFFTLNLHNHILPGKICRLSAASPSLLTNITTLPCLPPIFLRMRLQIMLYYTHFFRLSLQALCYIMLIIIITTKAYPYTAFACLLSC